MRRSKRGHCLLAIAAGLSAAGARAWAVDASDVLVYSVGSVRVKPHLALAEEYDDNIFYGPNKPTPGFRPVEDDFITIVSPGVSLQLGRNEANHIFFDYLMDQWLYARHDEVDHRDHSLSLSAKIKGNRVTLEGQARVQFLSGVLGGSLAQTAAQNVRANRVVYSDSYRVEYAISDKTSAYVLGNFNATDYKQGTPLYDQNDLLGSGGLALKLTPKTRILAELYYGQSAISPNQFALGDGPYSFFYGGFVGLSGDFTARLSGTLKVGYEDREFGNGVSGAKTPIVEVTLTDKFSDQTVVSLSYSRRSFVSVQAASQAYTADTVNAQLRQALTSDGRRMANIGGSLVNSEYETSPFYAGRHDIDYRASAALVYNIQLWLSARLAYEFETFNSNHYFNNQPFRYDDNRVTIGISVGY